MARHITYRCLSLLGVLGGLGGCSTQELAASEPLGQTQGAAVVSSIVEGDYVIRSVATNKCIDIDSASTADGAKVQEWDCNGSNAQKFHISPTDSGFWKIINVNSQKGLDITDVSTAQNALVHQWSYVGGANQQFQFIARGNNQFSFHPRHTGMAVDLSYGNAANGTILVQYPYGGTTNQVWTFDNVSGGTTTPPPSGTGISAVLSEATFNSMFPSRNGFYTYAALVSAANTFSTFATSGDTDTRKREVAAFLANVSHETSGLVYIEEINKAAYCDTSWGPPGCGCAAGKQYFGRGPLQLSWNGNYCAAGNALGVDLKNSPETVSNNATVAWRTAFWFWTTQTGAGTMTAHDAIVNGRGFGETIRTINGSLECNGKNTAQMQDRINLYLKYTQMLGVSAGANTGC